MIYRNQVDKLDCGISVIQLIHKNFYNKWINLSVLKKDVQFNQNGISLNELTKLAQKNGIKFDILKGDFEDFKKIKIKEPIISIVKNEHFLHYVVIEKILTTGEIVYFDPIIGKKRISLNEFEKIYFGIIILCSKCEYEVINISNNEIKLFSLIFIKEKIWITFSFILVIILSFVGTFYLKIVIDQIIPSNLTNKFLLITILFVLILIIKTLLNFVCDFINQRIESKYQILFIEKYINKLSTCSWLKIIHYGESDHLRNLEIMSKIASFKSKYLIYWISQSFCLLISSISLIILDFNFFLIALLISLISVSIIYAFKKKFISIENLINKNSKIFKKNYLDIINGLEQFKLNKTKEFLTARFDNHLNEILENQINISKVNNFYKVISSLIKDIAPFFIIFMCVNLIWSQKLSTGQLFLFLSMFSFFINSITFINSIIIEIPIMKQYCDNMNSFLNYQDEFSENTNEKRINIIKTIRLKDIKFDYGNKKSILNIKDLKINTNARIIGQNGSGKSTLMKMLATLIDNNKTYFNNELITLVDINHLRKTICLITSHDYFPSGSIYNYLTLSSTEKINTLLHNSEKYKLPKLFKKMNLNFDMQIEDGGKNFSIGQKQFISLMRVFSNNYSLVLLDEVFENFDEEIKQELITILKDHLKGKLVIEISHQNNYIFNNSKIINCDKFK